MSSFLCNSPEGPRRPTYQRLRTCLKCCWQHRHGALWLCECFGRFDWFKLSRAQQELNLAQGDSTPQRERLGEICMLIHILSIALSFLPAVSSCSWGSAGWRPRSEHTADWVTTARCFPPLTYYTPASWCTCESSTWRSYQTWLIIKSQIKHFRTFT